MKTRMWNKYIYTEISNSWNNIRIDKYWDHTYGWEVDYDYFWWSLKWSFHTTICPDEYLLASFKESEISKWYFINPKFLCILLIRQYRLLYPITE